MSYTVLVCIVHSPKDRERARSAASSPVRAAGTCYGYFDRLSRVAEFNIQQMGFLYKKINLNLVKMLQAGQ